MTWYAMFWIAGGNDILANEFHLSLNAITYTMRVAVFVAPVVAFISRGASASRCNATTWNVFCTAPSPVSS